MPCSFDHWDMRMSSWGLLNKAFPHWLKRDTARQEVNKPLLPFSYLVIRKRASLRINHHTKNGGAEKWKAPRSLMTELSHRVQPSWNIPAFEHIIYADKSTTRPSSSNKSTSYFLKIWSISPADAAVLIFQGISYMPLLCYNHLYAHQPH